jgi:hypothetical protein
MSSVVLMELWPSRDWSTFGCVHLVTSDPVGAYRAGGYTESAGRRLSGLALTPSPAPARIPLGRIG